MQQGDQLGSLSRVGVDAEGASDNQLQIAIGSVQVASKSVRHGWLLGVGRGPEEMVEIGTQKVLYLQLLESDYVV